MNNSPAFISGIEVDDLFGKYSYNLSIASSEGTVADRRLLLLYGDNGSGKTTIAQILFHLLSRRDKRGHRTFLAKARFRRFAVLFDDGSSLAAERYGAELIGSYSIVATESSGKRNKIDVPTDEEGDVGAQQINEGALEPVFSSLSVFPLAVYFLSDNRVLQSDVFEEESVEDWMVEEGRLVGRRRPRAMEHWIATSRSLELSVAPSIARADSWIRQQALTASSTGDVSTSNIYVDIVERIAKTPTAQPDATQKRLRDVIGALEELAARSAAFIPFGLSQPVPIELLGLQVRDPDPYRSDLLANVLEPYVNSLRSRLDAFKGLQRKLTDFLAIINAFYKRKTVRATIAEGITVIDEDGKELDSNVLSSGEKQLMLLLCNILVSTSQPSLYIIDEPELSLNVKWQRQLVNCLLSLVGESRVQYVMATHSIELLTPHKNSVVELTDLHQHRSAKA